MDIALGFAAGVMIAASFWSLLKPAIELAESSKMYGKKGEYAFLPVAGGFLLGAIFVFATDKIISYLGINSPHMMIGNLNQIIGFFATIFFKKNRLCSANAHEQGQSRYRFG